MQTASVEKVYQTTAILAGSMLGGALLFAVVAWFARQGDTTATDPTMIGTLRLAWYTVAAGSLAGAFMFKNRMRMLLETPGASERVRSGALTPQHVQTNTIISWALIEGAALLGNVVYFLGGPASLLVANGAYLLLAAIMFFPRRESFELFRQMEI